jgi:hypothetical protein
MSETKLKTKTKDGTVVVVLFLALLWIAAFING